MRAIIDKARVLIEALPYIKQFRGRRVVVKIGGAALEDPVLRQRFAEDVVLLSWVGIDVVVVHGGGKQVTSVLDRLGIQARFEKGLRVTDDATLEVVEMVLGGSLNQELVRCINELGGRAVGLTGKDGDLARARRVDPALGKVGQVVTWQVQVVEQLLSGEFIPVIAPIAVDQGGETVNVNADPFAAGLAAALGADKIVLLTDVEGVKGADGTLIRTLNERTARRLIADGVVQGGMIPKVENALEALACGIDKVHVVDGRQEHALLLEIFTRDGVGTEFVAPKAPPPPTIPPPIRMNP